MTKKMDPLEKAIAQIDWGKENLDKQEWLRGNYELGWIDTDNDVHVYVYEHIYRPAIRIYLDQEGNMLQGYLDCSDYEEEIRLHEDLDLGDFELLDDEDWPEDEEDFIFIEEENPEEKLAWALWLINKQAKAYRDEVKFNSPRLPREAINYYNIMKENYYTLKHITLKRLHKKNKLTYKGIHKCILQDKSAEKCKK
ncbi:hypothetical protein N0O92_18680 [Alkalihalobacillus sp. MEB130]|uniref:hypothetical protein n=1 Tax=Alkalihalobacillus sp. MEB130 TaxID=2976704 RepID=UPI0028E060F6|nr:hypothetical protein [Alkalihalobacillus sp. MEB130]MDT8862240.1 hypothetical protein [Alkalihalobacillus sp. MEB130]